MMMRMMISQSPPEKNGSTVWEQHCLRTALCESIRYQAKSEQNVRQDLIPRVRHGEAALWTPTQKWKRITYDAQFTPATISSFWDAGQVSLSGLNDTKMGSMFATSEVPIPCALLFQTHTCSSVSLYTRTIMRYRIKCSEKSTEWQQNDPHGSQSKSILVCFLLARRPNFLSVSTTTSFHDLDQKVL